MGDSMIIHEIDRLDSLHSLVRQDLKELGIKLPKCKSARKLNGSRKARVSLSRRMQDDVFTNTVFGAPLTKVPVKHLPNYGYVPQFLIDAAKVVDANIDIEGIFRKSGSISRQKELLCEIEAGKSIDSAGIHDLASVIKQFFRELPEPIVITVYHESFVKCYSLSPDSNRKRALLELCLLLPLENIATLRYILHMLNRVAAKNNQNKMTSKNLAVVMVPNLVHLNKGKEKMNSGEEKLLHIHTCIIELLITNWQLVGVVNGTQRQQLSMMSDLCVTDDEQLNDENTVEDTKDASSRKKRKRSGSLTGFVSSLAHGFSKLRRSIDGKSMNTTENMNIRGHMNTTANINMADIDMTASINVTSNSGEDMSLVTNDSMYMTQDKLVDMTTPCVMRKRKMCTNSVAFSASKKQAILAGLPQRSTLASTPFTPASTIKRGYYNPNSMVKPDLNVTAPAFGSLNATTPAMGSKTSRKKLNLFTTPSSSKKMKRPTADPTRPESPPASDKPGKSKNFFRRLSGSRSGKSTSKDTSAVASAEPSEDELAGFVTAPAASKMTTVSQPAAPLSVDLEVSLVVVDDQDPVNDFASDASALINTLKKQDGAPSITCEPQVWGYEVTSNSQINSEYIDDSSRKDNPPANENQLLDRKPYTPNLRYQAKLVAGQQTPVVSKVADGLKNSGLRCSRRDEFERVKTSGFKPKHESKQNLTGHNAEACLRNLEPGNYWHVEDSPDPGSYSPLSQTDSNVMDIVLTPPHGFGDQTLPEADVAGTTADPDEEEIDVGSNLDTVSLFSTTSGGTIMRRTDSGRYRLMHHSTSSTSLDSVVSYDSVLKRFTKPEPLQTSVSNDSLFSTESNISDGSARSTHRLTHYSSSDSGKGSLLGDASENVSSVDSGKPNDDAVMTKYKCHLIYKSADKKKNVSFR